MQTTRKIKFKGKNYILVGDKTDGAIATKEQFINGKCSYAHLFEDGDVRRFGDIIGSIKDIKFGKIVTLKVTDEAIKTVSLGNFTDREVF